MEKVIKSIREKAIALKNGNDGTYVCIFSINENYVSACHDIHAIHGIKPKLLKDSKKGKYFQLYNKKHYIQDFTFKS